MSNSLIYTRVSTSDQKTERQLSELLELTDSDGVSSPKIIAEKISGTKPLFDRREGSKIKELVISGEINRIYVHEISRLGRSVADVATAIEFLIDNKCDLVVMMSNLRLYKDGEIDISARMVLNVMLSMAQVERDVLSKRTKSGIAHARAQGKQIGRAQSAAGKKAEELILNGISVKKVVELTGLEKSSVYRIKRNLNK
jgi:putative DNA-invertase from lambdoid prophage Rac